MTTNDQLNEALVAIGSEVGTVAKASVNEHHKYRYASAEAVLSKVREACHRHGVAIIGSSSDVIHHDFATGHRIVRIEQTYGKGGASATFSGVGEGKDGQDKGTMKASTAALKYLLANAFNISWGDDPEASDPETGKSTATKGKAPAARASKAKETPATDACPTGYAALKQAVDGMTKATAADVKAAIKGAMKALDDQEYNALVAAYKAKEATL